MSMSMQCGAHIVSTLRWWCLRLRKSDLRALPWVPDRMLRSRGVHCIRCILRRTALRNDLKTVRHPRIYGARLLPHFLHCRLRYPHSRREVLLVHILFRRCGLPLDPINLFVRVHPDRGLRAVRPLSEHHWQS